MKPVYIEGVGLWGPGLDGWPASRRVLAGLDDYVPAPSRAPPSPLLPPNERRRAVETVKLALAAGAEAFTASGRDPGLTASIFASSGGDGGTIDEIMTVLASPNRELSPTRFHNSVHNAPSGYWGIAMKARAPSSSLCCHDGSFAAGLLEAVVQATTEDRPVALIAYDVCYPAPLSLVRPIGAAIAVALVLTPKLAGAAFAEIALRLEATGAATPVCPPALEALRRNTPAARALPLLAALARPTAGAVTLEYLDDLALTVDVTPISPASKANGC
jgi:hypothetical protein